MRINAKAFTHVESDIQRFRKFFRCLVHMFKGRDVNRAQKCYGISSVVGHLVDKPNSGLVPELAGKIPFTLGLCVFHTSFIICFPSASLQRNTNRYRMMFSPFLPLASFRPLKKRKQKKKKKIDLVSKLLRVFQKARLHCS